MVAVVLVLACMLRPLAAAPVSVDEIQRLGHTVVTGGNSVRLLDDPAEALRTRLELIGRARHHVFLSVPIWDLDAEGMGFLDAFTRLIEEKRAADPSFLALVELDTVTFVASRDWLGVVKRRLRKAGAKVRFFNPTTWVVAPLYAARQHDKILIVDGRWAILGDRNIGGVYFSPERHWFDMDVLLEGPAVHELQMHFLKTWVLMKRWNLPHNAIRPQEALYRQARRFWRTGHFGKAPSGRSPLDRYMNEEFFPPPVHRPDGVAVAVLFDNPFVFTRAPTMDLLSRLVEGAEREVDLVTPYPTFTREFEDVLVGAVRRGVRVRLLVNSRASVNHGEDTWFASLGTLTRLSAAGVSVFTWQPGSGAAELDFVEAACGDTATAGVMLHAKMVRIDGGVAMVHSSNFNVRSTFYNTEAGILVLDETLNRRIAELVDRLVGSGAAGGCVPAAARRALNADLLREYTSNRDRVGKLEAWSFLQ